MKSNKCDDGWISSEQQTVCFRNQLVKIGQVENIWKIVTTQSCYNSMITHGNSKICFLMCFTSYIPRRSLAMVIVFFFSRIWLWISKRGNKEWPQKIYYLLSLTLRCKKRITSFPYIITMKIILFIFTIFFHAILCS